MRVGILAIGRLREPEESAIVLRYCRRLEQVGRARGLGFLEVRELPESRLPTPEQRKADEAARLLAASGESIRVALDEHGRALSSREFADFLGKCADGGQKSCIFLLGGPDGHGSPVLEGCNLRLSLSRLTLPHGLARVVLAEQLYRAATLLTNHPYHRP